MVVSIRSDCCIALRMIALQAWYASEQELWEIEMGFWQNEKIEKQEAEIDRLRAENEKLRAANVELLRLFDEAMDGYADCIPYKGYFLIEKHGDKENFADLRAAAAALKEAGDE